MKHPDDEDVQQYLKDFGWAMTGLQSWQGHCSHQPHVLGAASFRAPTRLLVLAPVGHPRLMSVKSYLHASIARDAAVIQWNTLQARSSYTCMLRAGWRCLMACCNVPF